MLKNDYIDDEDNITEKYREEAAAECLASWPEELQPMQEGVQQLIQAIFDESKLQEMTEDGNKPKLQENDLNERFYKKEFQTLWNTINHRYIYTVNFDSQELIDKSVKALDAELYVSKLLYTVTYASQKSSLSADMLQEGSSFNAAKNHTSIVDTVQSGQAKYDLIGKIVENTTLTRRTVGKILQLIKPETFAKYAANPEEFIAKAIKIIKEQKASVIVDHITYNTTDCTFNSDIFTQEKIRTMDKAYKAAKAIQDYIFTDGMASYVDEDGTEKKSVERKFAEDLDKADEVYIYAKLPRGFYIPTPVGDYSPDWAIVFQEGATKHIYFIAETKGSLESLQLRPIEKAKLNCADRLFSKLSNGLVIYKQVSNYQDLLDKVMQ